MSLGPRSRRLLPSLFTALLLGGLSACAHGRIGMTEIRDTPENRAILGLVDEYQRAMESLDADAILALVSPDYYEDSGNTDPSDDYDRAGLAAHLRDEFRRTRAMHVEVRVENIEVQKEEGVAFAELYYNFRAQHEYPAGTKWETGSDRTRLTLERIGDRWLIKSGL